MVNRVRVACHIVVVTAFLAYVGTVLAQGDTKQKPKLPSSSIDPGSTDGNVYTSKALGLRIKYPARMVEDTRDELDRMSQEGLELYKQWDGKDVKVFEALANRERSVFGISTPEDADEPIASLLLSVVKDTGGELEPMVLRTIKMFTSAPNVKLTKPAKKVVVAGMTGFQFELTTEITGISVRSTIFSTRRNAHLMTFSITHIDDHGFEMMEKVLKEIELLPAVKN